MSTVITDTKFIGKKPLYVGKVRETYDLGNQLLMITTDRLSAFDCVFPNGIPDKGKVLNQISLFWFEYTKKLIPNHIVSADIKDLPEDFKAFSEQLDGRFIIAEKAERIDIECVVRGYLVGSGWKEYQESQSVCGIKLPGGLQLGSKLPEPIFTPATKEDQGHDINVSFEEVEDRIGKHMAEMIRDKALEVYNHCSKYAEGKGIILADTKMEFGIIGGRLSLIDELLTPDSSRFWPRETWKPGQNQISFDKQFIRDYLETLDWHKQPPAPELPADLVQKASQKYKEIYKIITGKEL